MLKLLQKSSPPEGHLLHLSYTAGDNADIFELSANIQAILDNKGSFQRINKAFADKFGIAPGVLPASFLLMVHEADRQTTANDLLNHPQSLNGFENRCYSSSGAVYWISWSMTHLPNGTLLLAGNDVTAYKEKESLLQTREHELEALSSLLRNVQVSDASRLVTHTTDSSDAEKHQEIIADKMRKLNKTEEELKKIIENSSEIIFKLDPEGAILFISPEFERSLGYKRNEVTGRSFCEFIHAEDQALCCKAIKAVFEKRKPFKDILARAETKEGSWRWFNISLSVLWDEEMNSLASIGFAQDITEVKQTLESLRESEERYATFVQHSSEAIWRGELINPVSIHLPEEEQLKALIDNCYLAECNDQLASIFGFPNTQLLAGKKLSDFFDLRDPYTDKFCRNFIRNGYKLNRWPYAITDQGVKKYFLTSLVGIVSNGFITRIWGTQIDISEQRRAEKALRESEARFRQLANTAPVMIWVTDAQACFSYVNQSWMDFTGLNETSLGNNKFKDMLHPDDVQQLVETYKSLWELRHPIVCEHRLRRFDGTYHWVVSHATPRVLQDGTFIGYIGAIIDIHERKWQEELVALEKEVLQLNAQSSVTLKLTINHFLEGIEKLMPDAMCSVLMLDEDGISARHLASPSLPDEYAEAIDGFKIGPQAGSCGTAMYIKKPVISGNIHSDPLWDRLRTNARRFGIQSCWSIPILNHSNEVLANLAAYYPYPRIPSEKELTLMERVGSLLRVIIENKKAEAKIRISNERYLLATKATNDALWDWDIATGKIFWGDGFYALFGYGDQRVDSIEFWEACIHPDDRQKAVLSLKQFMQQHDSPIWEAEYRFRKDDGKYALVHDRGFVIFNHAGIVNRMIGSMQDITEQREMEKKLLKQELDRQKLVAQAVVDAQEKERADIGKELHDNVNQILSTAKLYLEVARNDETERLSLLKRSTESISDAINEIRAISRSLVPASIGDLGLVESVQDLVENIQATKKLHIEFYHCDDIDEVISEKQKLMLFRIVQEQVNNILKHAEAKQLVIELMLEGNMIDLTISDDGKGFDPEDGNIKKGVGLYNISSRTELFNGKMNVITAPGKGCKLCIQVPILNQ